MAICYGRRLDLDFRQRLISAFRFLRSVLKIIIGVALAVTLNVALCVTIIVTFTVTLCMIFMVALCMTFIVYAGFGSHCVSLCDRCDPLSGPL